MRVQLTLLVVLVALVAVALAATFGVDRIEQSLIDDSLDDVAEISLFLEGVGFGDGVGVEVVDDGILVPLDDLDASEFFAIDELAEIGFGLEETVRDLDRLGALDLILDAVGRSRSEGLPVLSSFGVAVIVGIDGGPTEWIGMPADSFRGPLALETNLQEIVFAGLDASFNSAFEQATGPNGTFDETLFEELIDSQLDAQAEELEIRTGLREDRGLDFVVAADVAEVLRSVDRLQSVLWVATPFLVAAAAIITWILTGRALSPVRRMTQQVSAISGGNLHERVQVPSTGDEVEDLGATMNGMLDRLEADDHRLRQFISDASHELRSPVAVLRSEAEVALRAPDSTDASELAEGVLGESLRLEQIVSDLLVLARGDEAGLSVASTVVDVDDVVLAEAQRRRRVEVDTTAVSAGRVRGTPEGCARVIVHLLDNAARHAAMRVAIGLRSDGSEVTLTVDDDGPGIAPADRARVFERFTRLEEARTRDTGGAGLGLAVVAATVSAMSGTVEAGDSPLGGARLVVRWPAAS